MLVSSSHIFVEKGKFLKTTAFGGHPLKLVVSFPHLDIILLKGGLLTTVLSVFLMYYKEACQDVAHVSPKIALQHLVPCDQHMLHKISECDCLQLVGMIYLVSSVVQDLKAQLFACRHRICYLAFL